MRRSETVFVFGSGYSLNEISDAEWQHIAAHDVFGFNAFYHQRWVPANFHLLRGGLYGELRWVRAITDHLGLELVDEQAAKRQTGLEVEAIRDEAYAVLTSTDAASAQKAVRSWQMRAFRIEPALAFYGDLLKQLGLLGTVLGLGLSLATTGEDVAALLGPLALAVWTTVFGLAYSIILSALFGVKLNAWVDASRGLATAIAGNYGPDDFNAAITKLNDTKTTALNKCDAAYR